MTTHKLRPIILVFSIVMTLQACDEPSSDSRPEVPQGFASFSPNAKADLITDYYVVEKGELTLGTPTSDTTATDEPMHGRRFSVGPGSSLTVTVTAAFWGYAALYRLQDDGGWGDNLVMRWIEPRGDQFAATLNYSTDTAGTFLIVVGSPWSFSYSYSLSVDCNGTCSAATCDYNGRTLQVYQSIKSVDGCNTCSCGEDGHVACTELACGKVCEDTETKFYYFSTLTQCYSATFDCPQGTVYFDDSCGCGCEQSN